MSAAQIQPKQCGIVELDPVSVSRMLAEGSARLVDVREPDEHRRQYIPGCVSMPLSEFDANRLECRESSLTIFHCRTGGRSRKALERAEGSGKGPVAHMRGGIDAWKAAGLPVIEDRTAPLSAMQQTQILMGALVLVGTALGAVVSPWVLILPGFVGCGMVFAGLTGNCAMANLLGAMPWNRASPTGAACRI
ncbi:MAG: rhodanese family protein [Phycisphaeraceae bacterium]|nr:rhodanese family protein [Phycisphaeraceae bacterium]